MWAITAAPETMPIFDKLCQYIDTSNYDDKKVCESGGCSIPGILQLLEVAP